MRTDRPFGINPYSGKPPLQLPNIAHLNFLEINAKVTTSGNGRQLLEIPFVYENYTQMFVPRQVHVKWKEADQLELIITANYEIHVPASDFPLASRAYAKGNWRLRQLWDLKFGPRGLMLKPRFPVEKPLPKADEDNTFDVTLDGKTRESSEEIPIASTIFTLELFGEYTSQKTQFSVAGVTPARPTGVQRYYTKYDFAIYALGTNLPSEKISIPPSVLLHVVEFPRKDGDIDVQGSYIDSWVKTLEDEAPELHAGIMAGECPITLTGHASDTGDELKNRDYYAKKRIEGVREAILDRLVERGRPRGKIVFHSIPVGERDVRQAGPVTRERRVVISIDHQEAEKMILARRAYGTRFPIRPR
jgi:hypothetical protein